MFSWGNPEGQVTNSDLDMAGRVIHHTYMSDCFDIRQSTTMSQRDNTAGIWWQKKRLETSTSPPAHLLRFQAIY